MSEGALVQLVTQGTGQTSQNYAADSIVPIGSKFTQFDSSQRIVVSRQGDITEDFFMEFSVKALPEGYRWRQWAPRRFVARTELLIGGNVIDSRTAEGYMMGLFLSKQGLFQESEMEYLDPTRDHTFLLPLAAPQDIPLVALQYHEVAYTIHLNRLEELIETTLPIMCPNPLKSAQLYIMYRYLDTNERRTAARNAHDLTIISRQTCTESFPVNDGHLHFMYNMGGVTTATLIHIAAEDGSEFSDSVLTNVKMILNGVERWNLTNSLARVYHRELFAKTIGHQYEWRMRETPLTKNLYFMVHATGRLDNENRLQGLNASRIETIAFDLQFQPSAPSRVRITIFNEISNILMIRSGLGGLKYQPEEHSFGSRPQSVSGWEMIASGGTVTVSAGDVCPITMEPFQKGQTAVQCMHCKNYFTESAMKKWLGNEGAKRSNCPCCRKDITSSQIRRVEIHVVGTMPVEVKYTTTGQLVAAGQNSPCGPNGCTIG